MPTVTTFQRTASLLPIMLPKAGGCPAFILEAEARLAAIEFCERTRCWRHTVAFDADAPETPDIHPLEATIHEFELATANGNPLTPLAHTAIMGEPVAGTPHYITQAQPNGILVTPWPDDGTPVQIALSMFLKPRADLLIGLDADDPMFDALNVLPDFMVTQNARAIADGALARALMMPRKPWFQPKIAAVHRIAFEEAMDRQFRSNMRGQQRAPTRTRPADNF